MRTLVKPDSLTAQVEREGLVGELQAKDERLYEIIHDAIKYRAAVRLAIRDLSAGQDRALVLAGLARWESALRSLRRGVRKV